jgi:sulfur relay (sulfurtransferase) DsrF/TusC family protein
MKPSALFVIESDPRSSGRAAEAVRIAAGVGAWKKVDVAVYLRDAAVLILGGEADALVGGESYARYLPLFRDLGGPVYVQKGAALMIEFGEVTLPLEEISDEQLAMMAATRSCVLRF